MSHQNTYNHEESEPIYKKFISNIAYKFKFEVIEKDDVIWKLDKVIYTELADGNETPRNTIWYRSWLKLCDEYGESGI